jgi:Na+-transporting NADH:ubiquinone oxidoreductase subunit NqrF
MKKFKYKIYDYSNIIHDNPVDLYTIKSAHVDLKNNTLIIDYLMNLGVESVSISLDDFIIENKN